MRTSVAALLLVLALLATAGPRSEPIRLEVEAVPLDPLDPGMRSVGRLEYRGGLALRSDDHRFGGLSALSISSDGRLLTALSDQGHWFKALLSYDRRGSLVGVSSAEIGPLLDLEGGLLRDKQSQDAESMTVLPDGSVLVAFEHEHRIWKYDRSSQPLVAPAGELCAAPDLSRAPANLGLEAITRLADGRVLALTEDLIEGGAIRGWLWQGGRWAPVKYRPHGLPRPAGAALLPSGDVLVLERSYVPLLGNTVRLRRIREATIVPGAILDGEVLAELRLPLSVDNFEGVDCRRGEDGATLVYLLSDDNFNPAQRTLLLAFALRDDDV